MLKEFREFALRGNVVDLAVGVIIGAAFTTIVTSLVNDLLMPVIGLATGGADFSNLFFTLREGTPIGPYLTLEAAQSAGAITLNFGLFINAVVNFLIVSFVLFMVIRTMNRLKREESALASAPTTKICPFCQLEVNMAAVRCPHCTSQLN